MRGLGIWIAGVLAMLGAVVTPAHARPGSDGIAVPLCFARAAPGMTAASVLAAPDGLDCTTPQKSFGPGDYWAVSRVLPADVPRSMPIAIRSASLWQDKTTLYARYADGSVVVRRADDHAIARRIQLGAIFELRLPDREDPPVRLAWHVEGAANLRGIVNDARIATPAQSARANLTMGALYAAFVGFALALFAHNLALWRALRQRFQLWYMTMLVALVGYAASSSGALAWVFPDLANTDRMRVNYAILAAAAIAAIRFARHFFEPRVFAGWVGRLSTLAEGGVALAAASFVLLAPWQIGWLDRVYACAFLVLLAVVAPIMWRAWRTASDYSWLFALAWGVPIALTTIRVTHNLGFVAWSFWLDNSTLVAMTVEALISSFAIAYRVRRLADERDAARAEEIAQRLLADTDPLTGLLNRRAFLSRALGRAGQQRLLILDIDHFKRVNDTIGHDGGDEVLRRIARVLRAACPADGLAARLGGEEFALLSDAASAPDPRALLDALREMRMPFDLTVTASIGVCSGALADEADWKSLYRAADQALLQAKASGRDRARDATVPTALAA